MDFAQVEREVAKLRQELDAGRLTEEQFKAQMRDLMVEDEDGNWWMVGYETSEWYCHDGSDWVRADPPGYIAPEQTPPSIVPPTAVPREQSSNSATQAAVSAKPKPRRFWGIVAFLLGLVITFYIGIAGAILASVILDFAEGADWVGAIIGWLGGLILDIAITRKVWRRK